MATLAIAHFQQLQSSHKLSIIDLNRSISENDDTASQDSSEKRASDASNYSDENTITPASLAADLIHYKELFSKLRFSYLEQVTKEKFIRAITSSPPLFVDAADNTALENTLAEEKVALKAQKAEVAALTERLEDQARSLVQRFEALQAQSLTLSQLPEQISELEAAIAELREEYPLPDASVPKHLTLSLEETNALLEEQRRMNDDLDERIKYLSETDIPQADRELERLEDELAQLGAAKKVAVARAREARERKEGGGVDEVERRGRWCRAGEAVMSEIVG